MTNPQTTLQAAKEVTTSRSSRAAVKQFPSPRRRIWIDLENTPHVPFFKPIIPELEKKGHDVVLTARDCFQVCDLADMAGFKYKKIGHHHGKHTIAKMWGLGSRVLSMAPLAIRHRPAIALSHGSRSLFLLASILRIPTITIFDYEHSKWVTPVGDHWVIVPEVMPEAAILEIGIKKERILRYPGIKEDLYAPSFKPDPSIRKSLGVRESEVLVTIRPPAAEAHYRSSNSDLLLTEVFRMIEESPNTRAVLLPRTPKQEAEFRATWPALFEQGKMLVPPTVVDGLDLVWYSDLVVSGGGTMNREAAALGVPVFSVFRGKTGSVDKYLAESGRLTMLECPEDARARLHFTKRVITDQPNIQDRGTLKAVVEHICHVLSVY